MYDQLYALEVINRERQKELNKQPFYLYRKGIEIKLNKKQPAICKAPVMAKLPQCQCQ